MEDTGDIEHHQHSPDTVPKEVDQTDETMEPAAKKVKLSENVHEDNKRDETSTQGQMSDEKGMTNTDLTMTTGDEDKNIGALNTFEKNAQLQDEKTDQSSGSDKKDDKTESGCEAGDNAVKEKLSAKLDTTISSTEEEPNETINLQDAIVQTDMIEGLPDFVPPEETNFLRFCHLIQKVAPQAVRHKFDQVFPPPKLEGEIKENMTVIEDLRRRKVITHDQLKLICPQGIAPVSSNFDVTTMMCLFRHLKNLSPKSGLYDTLPPSDDTTLAADLARIKFFRNHIAHYVKKDRKINNKEFQSVWETVATAISRIGGPFYKQECSSLRTANLDSSFKDIYGEFLIKEMDLKEKIVEHKEEIQKLQIQLDDPVPKHERGNIRYLTEKWESTKQLFIETSAAKSLLKIMETENVAIVTGSPGTGKSFTVQNVLLSMRAEGYDVIPVSSSSELVRYFSRNAQQVFCLDNLCGKHNISNSDIEEWDRNRERLVDMFTNLTTKCILICRLQIFLDPLFENLQLKTYEVINLSRDHQLSLKEKQSVGQIHVGNNIMKQLTDKTIINCLCFPLLCSLYDKHSQNTELYFRKPKTYFENELKELRKRPDKTKYGCIALCVMFNNKVDFDFFSRTNEEESKMIRSMFEELEVNSPPKKAIQSCFDSMVGSFFQKTYTGYKSIHDYMFDIYCGHVSKIMINMIILYGDSRLIRDRALLQSLGKSVENAVIIPGKFEKQYFERIVRDLSLGRVGYVFDNSQMKYKSYRTQFISLVSSHDFNVNVSDEYSTLSLYKASEAGYVDIVELLCDKRADVNKCDWSGSSPLDAAAGRGHIDVVELLCSKGADVNTCDLFGSSPLISAARGVHIDVVELLCNKGADVNKSGVYGLTPLTAASDRGHIDVVELLCNKGADVNHCDRYGWKPLTAASKGGHIDVVKLLCSKGADVNQCGEYDSTPLIAASYRGHIDVVELLCNKGAHVNQCDENGSTPLTVASGGGHIDVVEQLCSKGAHVNQSSKYGSTPLIAASTRGHINVVELLCNKGGDVDKCDNSGLTPLTVASTRGHINVVELLCNKGADVNKCGEYGLTPLIAASTRGHINVVELLCNKGGDVHQCSWYGSTPLTAASEGGHIDVVELLCDKGADVNQCSRYGSTPLTAASAGGHIDVVELLCDKEADVNQCCIFGSTPLTAASEQGHINIVKFLCNKGADVNQCDENGSTPLTAASLRDHIDVVEQLCNKGADVNQRSRYGSTPLTAASRKGYIKVVELLCNKGADVNKCDLTGSSPLTAAAGGGHIVVVELLCNKGAELHKCGEHGLTPLTKASGNGHIDVVKMLCNKGADVNQCGGDGWTPLTAASAGLSWNVLKRVYSQEAGGHEWDIYRSKNQTGRLDVVELLCNKGADVNQCCKYGWTPLTVSSKCENLNVLDYLSKKGGK